MKAILDRMTDMGRRLHRELAEGLPEQQIATMEQAFATIMKHAGNSLRSQGITEEV